jgi:hypothetical protein
LVLCSVTMPDQMYGDAQVSAAMYNKLDGMGKQLIGNAPAVAYAYHIIGPDAEGDYTEPLDVAEATLTGEYSGICPVTLDEPAEVGEIQTLFVPALEFKITKSTRAIARARETRKSRMASAVLNFKRVAVPLVGQTPTIYSLSQDLIDDIPR